MTYKEIYNTIAADKIRFKGMYGIDANTVRVGIGAYITIVRENPPLIFEIEDKGETYLGLNLIMTHDSRDGIEVLYMRKRA